jgi:hypothetical protein
VVVSPEQQVQYLVVLINIVVVVAVVVRLLLGLEQPLAIKAVPAVLDYYGLKLVQEYIMVTEPAVVVLIVQHLGFLLVALVVAAMAEHLFIPLRMVSLMELQLLVAPISDRVAVAMVEPKVLLRVLLVVLEWLADLE